MAICVEVVGVESFQTIFRESIHHGRINSVIFLTLCVTKRSLTDDEVMRANFSQPRQLYLMLFLAG